MTREQGEQILLLIEVGYGLSNAMYNWRQDGRLPSDVRDRMEQFVNEWDAAEVAAADARKLLRQLPPAFDPIALGA